MAVSEDRISGLPEAILHHILSFLLAKDATRTSATCKRLNQVLTTLPYLNLGLGFFPVLPDIEDDTEDDNNEGEGGIEDDAEEEGEGGIGDDAEEEGEGGIEDDAEDDDEEDNSEGEGDIEDDGEDVNSEEEDNSEEDGDDDDVDSSSSEEDDDYSKVYTKEERSQIVRNREQLFTFVEQTLTRRRMQDITIHKFLLGVTEVDDELRENLDRWIEYLVHCNINDLVLQIGTLGYDLPPSLLTAKSLYALNLKRCRMPSGSIITLPSLRKLHLEFVSLDEQFLKDIINTCRGLEDLCLVCCPGLGKRIQISGQSSKLSVLLLTPTYRDDVEEIVVEAQYLEKLTITGAPRPIKINIITGYEASLKCLELVGVTITNTWFCELISRLSCLEELELMRTGLKAIEISSSSLKRLILREALKCEDNIFGEFTIDTPNLVYLTYAGGLSSRFINKLAVKEVLLQIDGVKTIHGGDQLCRLSSKFVQFLHVFNYSEVGTLDCCAFERMIFPVEKRLTLLAPLTHIKHLILRGRFESASPCSLEKLLESLLWTCPNLDNLSLKDNFLYDKGFPVDLAIEFTPDQVVCSTLPWRCVKNCLTHGTCKLKGAQGVCSTLPLSCVRDCLTRGKYQLKGARAEVVRFLRHSLNHCPSSLK